jgi:hypothetical protein
MNKQRRAKIEAEVLAAQTAIEALRFALQNLQDLATEEQECFDNMPEGLQASENGQRIEEIAQAFESANTPSSPPSTTSSPRSKKSERR